MVVRTDQPADCVDSHELDDGTHVIAIGTYLLNKTDSSRSGRVYLTRDSSLDTSRFTPIESVFDLKFITLHGCTVLVVADCSGFVNVFDVDTVALELSLKSRVKVHDGLAFYIAQQGTTIVTTGSDGRAVCCTAGSDWGLTVDKGWKAHEYDPWCCALHPTDAHTVFTGGDDCMLHQWDARAPTAPVRTSMDHTAGVTCMAWHRGALLTGSYDGIVRRFDLRNLRAPVSSVDTGAGVWRVVPRGGSDVAGIANMHQGFSRVDLEAMEVVGRYTEHGLAEEGTETGLGYGVAWAREGLACVSFYDQSYSIWSG